MSRPILSPDLGVRCFSQLAGVRCQGLSNIQHIATFIPVACLVAILPPLLISTWRLPRTSLLLLAIEIILQLGVDSWDLGYWLDRPCFGMYRTTDIALAIASATPVLVFLLVLTSHLLSDLRQHLPLVLRKRVSSVLYAAILAPLVPLAYAGTLLGGFAFVQHSRIRGVLLLDFGDVYEEWVNVVLTDTGTIAALSYILFISLISLTILLHPPSTSSYALTHPSTTSLWITTLSLLLSAIDIGLGLIPLTSLPQKTGFVFILIRKILLLLSRAGIAGGLIRMYTSAESRRKRLSGIYAGVGGPVRGTFRRLSTDGTREFYAQKLSGVEGVPVPPDKVILRTPRLHAPKLSFTSSAFAAFQPPTPLRNSPTSSPVNDNYTPRSSIAGIHPGRKTKMNLGSLYAPKRITVDPLDLAQWPPPPPRPESGTLPLGIYPPDPPMGLYDGRSGVEGSGLTSVVSQGTWGESVSVQPPSGDRSRPHSGTNPFEGSSRRSSPSPSCGDTVDPIPFRSVSASPSLLHPASSVSRDPSPIQVAIPALRRVASYRTASRTVTPAPSIGPAAPKQDGRAVWTVTTPENRLSQVGSTATSRYSPRYSYTPQTPGDPDGARRSIEYPIVSPVSSYAPSSANRQTLFYSTPVPSPTMSPVRPDQRQEEYLISPSPHPQTRISDLSTVNPECRPESGTLPIHAHHARTPESQDRSSFYLSSSTAILASLARLRRETGMKIDESRLSGLSGLNLRVEECNEGRGMRGSGVSGFSGISDISVERIYGGVGGLESHSKLAAGPVEDYEEDGREKSSNLELGVLGVRNSSSSLSDGSISPRTRLRGSGAGEGAWWSAAAVDRTINRI